MVVGAQEDILLGMFAQRGVDIHRLHVGREMTDHVVDGRALRIGALAHLLRTVVLHGGRDDHAIHIHLGEGLLILVGGLGIACAALAGAAVGHQRTHMVARAHDDDACIGDLRILIGGYVVLVVVVGIQRVQAFKNFRLLRFLYGVGGVEGDVLLAGV